MGGKVSAADLLFYTLLLAPGGAIREGSFRNRRVQPAVQACLEGAIQDGRYGMIQHGIVWHVMPLPRHAHVGHVGL